MTGPTFSPDGKWMWNGTEWIPAPPQSEILPKSEINHQQIQSVAIESGVDSKSLEESAPYFDENRDGHLQTSEIHQAAMSISQQPTLQPPQPIIQQASMSQPPPPPPPPQPIMQQASMPQPPPPQPMVQQPMVQQPMVQQLMIQDSTKKKKMTAILICVGIVIAGIGVYIVFGVLFRSPIAYDSPYTWDGNIDDRIISGQRWTDWESDFQSYEDNRDIRLSTGLLDLFAEGDITSYHHQFNWPYSTTTGESDGSDWSTMRINARNQINGDVWFSLITGITIDGDYTEYDDGECGALVGNNVFYKDGNGPTDNNWRSVVGDTNWPSFCDSVTNY